MRLYSERGWVLLLACTISFFSPGRGGAAVAASSWVGGATTQYQFMDEMKYMVRRAALRSRWQGRLHLSVRWAQPVRRSSRQTSASAQRPQATRPN